MFEKYYLKFTIVSNITMLSILITQFQNDLMYVSYYFSFRITNLRCLQKIWWNKFWYTFKRLCKSMHKGLYFFMCHNIILIKNVHFRLGEYVSWGGLHDFVFAFLPRYVFWSLKFSNIHVIDLSRLQVDF